MKPRDDQAVVRTSSHRGYDYLRRLCEPENMFYWNDRGGRWTVHVHVIPREHLAAALTIKGVTEAKRYGELHRAWTSEALARAVAS